MQTLITRFAPSPTGFLHLGGARTALFSWLLAKNHGGIFYLRIDDTDQERSNCAYLAGILDGLSWLGIDYQEVFFQSQRLAIYQQWIDFLLEQGLAYICVCARVLDQADSYSTYDGRCRDLRLKPDHLKLDHLHVVRLKVPKTGKVTWSDGVMGKISVSNEHIEDFVIQRSNGMPVYNFCSVIDDIELGITDIIRGSDHISNTARQIHIFHACQKVLPRFSHVPLILNREGKKLSKRDNAENLLHFRDAGYLSNALKNYLFRLGFGYRNQEIFSYMDMVQLFSINRLGKSPAKFDLDKLHWFNKQYMGIESSLLSARYQVPEEVIRVGSRKVNTLQELESLISFLFSATANIQTFDHALVIKIYDSLVQQDFRTDLWSSLQQIPGVSKSDLGNTIRLILTGDQQASHTFKINQILQWLGKEEVLKRLAVYYER